MLLRLGGRRGFLRRSVFVGALAGMLLLAPSATAVPGDPTPPTVTPIIFGTLGANGWYTTVTSPWTGDPESPIEPTPGCNGQTIERHPRNHLRAQQRATASLDG